LSTLAPPAHPLTHQVLDTFAEHSARATIIVPGYSSQCPGRLVAVDPSTVTLRAFDPLWLGRLLSGVSLGLVMLRDSNRYGCFFANIRRVLSDGRVMFEMPNHVSVVMQRQAQRQVLSEGLDVTAILQYGGGSHAVRVRDVSAQGIGLVLDDERPPPADGANVQLILGLPDRECTLPCGVKFVSGRRIGVEVAPNADPSALLEFAAFLGRINHGA